MLPFERRIYSQNGEDGVLAHLFEQLGAANRYYVEFGTGPTARECNTRHLEEIGWRGLRMDGGAKVGDPRVKREMITAENINELFARYKVPEEFDLLSIDIDGNDYWVWNAIDVKYRPRVIVCEYNGSVAVGESRTIAYEPAFRWSGTNYYGASLSALTHLANRRGYALAYCESCGVNAFYIRRDLFTEVEPEPADVYVRPNYFHSRPFMRLGYRVWRRLSAGYRACPLDGHRVDANRKMELVAADRESSIGAR